MTEYCEVGFYDIDRDGRGREYSRISVKNTRKEVGIVLEKLGYKNPCHPDIYKKDGSQQFVSLTDGQLYTIGEFKQIMKK